jgi:hypothetical protein
MATEQQLRNKINEVKILHADYKEAQADSNAALARYKRAIAELESM